MGRCLADDSGQRQHDAAPGGHHRYTSTHQRGHFEQRVKVTTNDELGYVGDIVNEMAGGLEEREFIKETFGK